MVLGEMDVARVKQKKKNIQEESHECEKHLGRIPPAGGGRQLSERGGGRLEVASLPVDDVHQARITQGIGDGG